MPPSLKKKPKTNQENTQLYDVISDNTVLILKMQYLHTFSILIIFVSIAVVFPVREISVKKPLALTEYEWERHVPGHKVDN